MLERSSDQYDKMFFENFPLIVLLFIRNYDLVPSQPLFIVLILRFLCHWTVSLVKCN